MISKAHTLCLPGWIDHVNRTVLTRYHTRLVGGHDEPFYCAPGEDSWAEIRFTRDYERSALHELAHWCVAGESRRLHDDYGYWYAPDGRSAQQQAVFFQVEIVPQAIEKHFCQALGIPFSVSVDNLGNPVIEGVDAFACAVDECHDTYVQRGLPARAAVIRNCLQAWRDATIVMPSAAGNE